MKKIYAIILLLSSVNLCHAALFGVSAEYVKNKTTEFKNEMSAVRGDLSAVKGDVSGVKSNIGKLETRIGNIEAKATAQGAAVVGLKNDIQQTNNDIKVGRDATINSGNNDTSLMKLIFSKTIGIIISIIGLIGTLVASYERQLRAKDKWIENLIKSNDVKDAKLDAWFQEKLGNVLNGHKN